MAELANRDKHEAAFVRRLGRLSGRHRKELQGLLGHPPDVSNVPESFWLKVERETVDEIIALLLLIFIASATQHGASQSEAAARAAVFAGPQAKTVAKSFADTGRDMLQRSGREWAEAVQREAPVPRRVVLDRLAQIFGPDRVVGVARTETTNAGTSGSEAGVAEAAGLSEDDTWFTERDQRVCPICAPLHGTNRDTWAAKFPSGPPAHPRCRCWIKYAANIPAKTVGAT